MGAIYKIINVVNDAFYVGSAVNPRRRKWEHWKSLKENTHHCSALQDAWNLYGEDAFYFEIVEEVPDDRLLMIEDIYLHRHHGQENCYNTASSTFMTPSYQAEVRDKISNTLRTKYKNDKTYAPRLGKKHSEETKELIRQKKLANPSRAWLGKTRDEATRKKIGDTQRGVKKSPRVYTEEGLQKARENMKRNAKKQQPLEFDSVKAKFPQEVIDKYDFTNAVYTGALNRITGCKCPKHGEFSQYAAQFRKGRGCPQCGNEERAEAKRNQMKEFWSTEEGRSKFIDSRKQ